MTLAGSLILTPRPARSRNVSARLSCGALRGSEQHCPARPMRASFLGQGLLHLGLEIGYPAASSDWLMFVQSVMQSGFKCLTIGLNNT